MKHKKPVTGALVLIVLTGVAAALGWYVIDRQPTLAFAPETGDSHDYLVGTRVILGAGDSLLDPKLTSRGVVRYRFEKAGERVRLHAAPLRLMIDSQEVYSSVDPAPRAKSVTTLLRDGFELTLDSDGTSTITPVNKKAMEEIGARFAKLGANPFEQQIVGPALGPDVPLREGERITLDDFQGLGALTFEGERLTPEHVWLQVSGVADTLGQDSPIVRQLAEHGVDAKISDVKVQGRMKVDRLSGWLHSMTLATQLRVSVGDESKTLRTLVHARRKDSLRAGGYGKPLDVFDRLPDDAFQAKAMYWTDSIALNPSLDTHTDPKLESWDTEMRIDPKHVTLHLAAGDRFRPPIGSLEIEEVTLYDDQGHKLD